MYDKNEIKEAIRNGFWPPESSMLPGPLPFIPLDVLEKLDPEVVDPLLEEIVQSWAEEYKVELH